MSRKLQIAGHAPEAWPTQKALGEYTIDEAPPVRQYDQDYETRGDAAIYSLRSGMSGSSPDHWELRNEKHFYRGVDARKRQRLAVQGVPWHEKKRAASKLSWDKYIEKNHRFKDLSGSALFSRRWTLPGLATTTLVPDSLAKKLNARRRLPLLIRDKAGQKTQFEEWLALARRLRVATASL